MSLQAIGRRAYHYRNSLSKFRTRAKSSKTNSTEESPLRQLLDEASTFGEERVATPELQWATQPYAARPAKAPEQPEGLAPQEAAVLLFPGQGSQRVGMGQRLADVAPARELYTLASDIVGWDVWRVCTEGPEEELTSRCQTATLVTALAALERAREIRPGAVERVRAVAGFSLGEIAALVFAEALSFEAALRFVELRTAAMRAASAERPGGMLTLWLAADARLPEALLRARDHAAERGVVEPVAQVANYLYPSCKVIAGDEEALKWLERSGGSYGVRRAARVAVEGAFHTPLMRPAEPALRAALDRLAVRAPRVAVVSAVDARAYGDAAHVRRTLARHVAAPVRWEQALHALYARPRGAAFPLTLALGPGGALRATLRQVNARAWDSSVQIDV